MDRRLGGLLRLWYDNDDDDGAGGGGVTERDRRLLISSSTARSAPPSVSIRMLRSSFFNCRNPSSSLMVATSFS